MNAENKTPPVASEGSKATAGYVATVMEIAAPNSAKADTSYVILEDNGDRTWSNVATIQARDADAAKLAYCQGVKEFQSATLVAIAAKFWKESTVKAQTVTTTNLVIGEAL